MTAVDPWAVVALLQTLTLLVTGLLLVFVVVRYPTNVAHARGFLALAAAYFLVTGAAVDAFLAGPSTRTYLAGLGAALAAFVGVWVFARPFLSFANAPDPGAERGFGPDSGDGDRGDSEGFGRGFGSGEVGEPSADGVDGGERA